MRALLGNYGRTARRHPVVAIALALIAAVDAASASHDGHLARAGAYFLALAATAVIVDLVAERAPTGPPFPVRRPRGEATLVIGTAVIGAALFLYRSAAPSSFGALPPPARAGISVVIVGFILPVVSVAWLLSRGYGLRDLGFRARGILAAPAVAIVFAAIAMLLCPEATTWRHFHAETVAGLVASIAAAGLAAGLSEEVFRFLAQTRLGAAMGNDAAAWLLASVLWGALHVPRWWAAGVEERTSLRAIALGCALSTAHIVPIGLLWGYATRRLGSVIPSILIHAVNVWGLQNL
jgi:membrane protease YdiL (CAAX protease family)